MNKFNLFLEKHGIKVIIVLLFLTYMKSCSVNSEVTKVKKQITVLDSLATKKDLEIEGLKAEKRMIQSTDRKMMDVNRQTEIDKQIETLSK